MGRAADQSLWNRCLGGEACAKRLAEKRPGGEAALAVMERELAGRDWLAAGRYTIADIALYAYTHMAPEGGFAPDPYPTIRAWLRRVEAQPGHVPIG